MIYHNNPRKKCTTPSQLKELGEQYMELFSYIVKFWNVKICSNHNIEDYFFK